MGRIVPVLAAVAIALAACGGEPTPDIQPAAQPSETGTFPVTIQTDAGPVRIEARPERIISLSPTATEMLFAVGAGDQVVAVDDQSNYPEEAPTTTLSGYEPNIEAIAGYEPDLVVASDTTTEKQLKDLKIPLMVQPAVSTLDGTYEEMEQLGVATGNVSDAAEAVSNMQSDIEEVLASVPDAGGATYYHELDDTYYSVTSKTFIGHVYGLFGLKNIADKAKNAGSGYPQLSAEYIIEADPDFVFLADTKCCKQSQVTVEKRPGWDQIAAVENDSVIELDDDIASRWGPRVIDFVRTVARAIESAELATT